MVTINMHYCRIQNTLEALLECVSDLDDIDWNVELLGSDREKRALEKLIATCDYVLDHTSENHNHREIKHDT